MEFPAPIAFLSCANIGGEDLPQVQEELKSIQNVLQPLQSADFLSVPELLLNVSSTDIFEIFTRHLNSIQVFHFAGHADGEKILIETGGHAAGLSGLFGLQKNLALVFINGCRSEGQAKRYLDAGVKVVLATNAKIKDKDAPVFASKFYEAMAAGQSILDSYIAASSFLALQSANYRNAGQEDIVVYRGTGFDHDGTETTLPWRLFVQEGFQHHLSWKFTQETALMNRLRWGSLQYYRKLKEGRYKHVQIENVLLSEMQGFKSGDLRKELLFDTKVIISRPEKPSDEIPLQESLIELWNLKTRHLLLKGEGGTGKTVSILKLWEEFNEQTSIGMPIPVFVALNEYNRMAKESASAQKDFILNYIANQYLGMPLLDLKDHEKKALLEDLKTPLSVEPYKPSVLLFLDGLNEVSVDSDGFDNLWEGLQDLVNVATGTQIVITSRNDSRHLEFAKDFNLVEIQPLDQDRVNQYLADKNINTREMSKETKENLLRNPMMLTLLAASSDLVDQYKDETDHFEFKLHVSTAGEVIWNFMEATLAKCFRDDGFKKNQFIATRLVLRHLLPFLGFEMEQNGMFSIHKDRLEELIKDFMMEVETDDFLDTFDYFNDYLDQLGDELYIGIDKPLKSRKQVEKIKTYLLNRLQIMVEEGDFRFLHQNFRDFFAAAHILNNIALTKRKRKKTADLLPSTLDNQYISAPVAKLLGEICGEHKKNIALDVHRQYQLGQRFSTTLDDQLDALRGQFDSAESALVVANILNAKVEARNDELCGDNFSQLDLTKAILNGKKLSAGMRHPGTWANLKGARLDIFRMLPQGHGDPINDVAYHPNGRTALSASEDMLVKEFDLAAQACIMEYRGHQSAVKFARYFSIEGTTVVLSVAQDGQVKLWNRLDGSCLQTIETKGDVWSIDIDEVEGTYVTLGLATGQIIHYDVAGQKTATHAVHQANVMAVFLLPDKKRIVSASWDSSVKIWDTESNEVMELYRHEGPIRCASYHATSGCFLSASNNQQLCLLDIKTGALLADEITEGLVCTSLNIHPKGGKCLATAWSSKDILEIDFKHWDSTRHLASHDSTVYRAVYLPGDGSKILSGSEDRTIREWDAQSSECIFHIESSGTRNYDIAISPDGKRMLSAHTDKQIKEWDLEKKVCLAVLTGHKMGVSSVRFNHNGTVCFSSSRDWSVRAWDLGTGLNDIVGSHQINFDSVAEAQEKSWLLTGTRDGVVKIWDLQAKYPDNLVKEFSDLFQPTVRVANGGTTRNSVNRITVRPDQKKALLGAIDRTVLELDLDTFAVEQVQHTEQRDLIRIKYDQKGQIHAIARDGEVLVWVRPNMEPIVRFTSQNVSAIAAADFSPDFERCVIAAESDATFTEIDLMQGKERVFPDKHAYFVPAVCYLPDGHTLASCSYDGTLKLWDAPTGLCTDTFNNLPGMFIQGCDMREVSFGLSADLEQHAKKLLATYGAKLTDRDFL